MAVSEFGRYYGELFTKIARKEIKTAGAVIAVYYDDEFDENNSDIEVGITVENKEDSNNVIGGCLCAMTVHKGSYGKPYRGLCGGCKVDKFKRI